MSTSAEIFSRLPLVSWLQERVPPPGALYVDRDDRLFLNIHNSAATQAVQVRARLLVPQANAASEAEILEARAAKRPLDLGWRVIPIVRTAVPTSDRASNFFSFDLAEGFLLGLIIFVDAVASRRGQTWVQCGLVRGGAGTTLNVQTLVADYAVTGASLGWPGGRIIQPVEGPGFLRSVAGTDPAAGAEISETVPTDARWLLVSWRASFVTDGTAANREPQLVIDDGTTALLVTGTNVTQTATQTRTYDAAAYGARGAYVSTSLSMPLPPGLRVFQGWRIRTSTIALQAGDNWGAPQMLVEERLED